MMEKIILAYLIILIFLTLLMLLKLFRGTGVYDHFVGILVMSTNVILILILIGFVDGRKDMYIDVAVSYAVLGFISSVIIAKFMGGHHHDHLVAAKKKKRAVKEKAAGGDSSDH